MKTLLLSLLVVFLTSPGFIFHWDSWDTIKIGKMDRESVEQASRNATLYAVCMGFFMLIIGLFSGCSN